MQGKIPPGGMSVDMKKIIYVVMLGAALVCSSCANKERTLSEANHTRATESVSQPNVGKGTSTSQRKLPAKSSADVAPPSKYTYTGPRMPGLKVSHVSVPGNYVALTFDDGPNPALTPRVLDILNQYGAKATFFVVGRSVEKNSHILARAVAEGHEIGAHTWSHIKMTTSGSQRVVNEMDRTNAAIQAATGLFPKIMRPPYGAVNTNLVSLMKSRYGMSTIMWDVDTRDWQHPGVDVVVQRAVGRATPGSIILLHDIHESTLRAVEGVVSGLQARGFRMVTVSQLLALGRMAAQQASQAQPQPENEQTLQPTEQPHSSAAPQQEENRPEVQPLSLEPIQTDSANSSGAASISGAIKSDATDDSSMTQP